jgi:glycyl-tRNA synthetase (class II)
MRVTVGRKTLEDGAVDIRDRATSDERRVSIDELAGAVAV